MCEVPRSQGRERFESVRLNRLAGSLENVDRLRRQGALDMGCQITVYVPKCCN